MKSKIFIISGKQGSGKTTFLTKLIEHLHKENKLAGGIIAHGFWKNNERSGFELENIRTGEKIILCQTDPVQGWEKFRRFYFNPEGFVFGNSALEPEYIANTDIIVIDEVGPLELEDKGWAQAIKSLLKTTGKPVIFVVRESLTKDIIKHFKIENSIVIDTGLSAGEVAKTIFG